MNGFHFKLFLDRIYRIHWIFLISHFPEENEKTQSDFVGKITYCSFKIGFNKYWYPNQASAFSAEGRWCPIAFFRKAMGKINPQNPVNPVK
jgi:hypothetical protein